MPLTRFVTRNEFSERSPAPGVNFGQGGFVLKFGDGDFVLGFGVQGMARSP